MTNAEGRPRAAPRSSLPAPQVTLGTAPVKLSARAVSWRRALMREGVAFTHSLLARRSAAPPVTCGADMLVPERILCTPSTAVTGSVAFTSWEDKVEVIPKPGAVRSGFGTPSRRGPWLEKDAMAPVVGWGLKQWVSPSSDAQHGFVAYAPTETTESASPGELITPPNARPWLHAARGPVPPARLFS